MLEGKGSDGSGWPPPRREGPHGRELAGTAPGFAAGVSVTAPRGRQEDSALTLPGTSDGEMRGARAQAWTLLETGRRGSRLRAVFLNGPNAR